ncbi:zinc finger A20 and AN1 domain-containing stress-associated protein 5-like isoform X1 [Lycium ferocissimum]|uniref:zinc finger A20 and AN1 domain-containing stress-associated protein 5-like isoform X1 n=1 Tax=Lycium ferocissimum TaxID=112874 RepID=UPI002814DBDB|nr:zinc finger A20 and AN1 domain-containing stress-associated protein 5-like isoform X1 [Lycium ferocissimum]
MAAQQREKEETELKVPDSINPLCSQTLPTPAPPPPPPPHPSVTTRSENISDLNLSGSNESRSTDLPERIDLKLSKSSSDIIDLKFSSTYESKSKISCNSSERIDLKLFSTSESKPSSDILDLKFSSTYEARSTSAKSQENTVIGRKRQREVNRCCGIGCRRKVGLIPFRCRCGEVFCSEHRYSDRHDCSYDYKAAGREAIARENPVVKAAKILKV